MYTVYRINFPQNRKIALKSANKGKKCHLNTFHLTHTLLIGPSYNLAPCFFCILDTSFLKNPGPHEKNQRRIATDLFQLGLCAMIVLWAFLQLVNKSVIKNVMRSKRTKINNQWEILLYYIQELSNYNDHVNVLSNCSYI